MKITVRNYKNDDRETASQLFYDTVHSVNAADYTEEQLSAWAETPNSLKPKCGDLSNQTTLIATLCGKTVGFGSITKSGELDLLFVHKNFQRQGIATALCDELEKGFSSVTTYASITAKPFFEKRGYTVIKEREVERAGVRLKNFEMRKHNKPH